MRRLIVVFNPESSKFGLVEKNILNKTKGLSGFLVGKFEVLPIGVEKNVKKLAKILLDGDLVIAAGGDATASIAINGCLNSGKDVVFSALSFGNFNDTAGTLGNLDFEEVIGQFSRGRTKRFYPLEVKIDGRHFRYAAGYVTVGMFAKSAQIFDNKEIRQKLKKGKMKVFSYFELAKWYFKHRKEMFLPERLTDYVAVNGTKMAGIMRGKKWFLTKKFKSGSFRLSSIAGLGKFMLRSILREVPGEETRGDILDFGEKTEVMIQMEGEYRKIECRKIEIAKGGKIRVVMR